MERSVVPSLVPGRLQIRITALANALTCVFIYTFSRRWLHVQPLPNSVHVGQLPSNCSAHKSFIREGNRRGLGLSSFLSLESFPIELRVSPANVIVGYATPPFGLNLIVGALTSFDYPWSTRAEAQAAIESPWENWKNDQSSN